MERRIPLGTLCPNPIPDPGAPLPCWPADDADMELVVDGPERWEARSAEALPSQPTGVGPGPEVIRALSF